jgi:5-hydroxyisourate hydrolase
MSPITTQVLDTANGKPAAGIAAVLERKTHTAGWQAIAEGTTDLDGRINDLLSTKEAFLPGHYRFIFETGAYYLLQGTESFFPQVTVSFAVKDPMQHYHVPVLVSPFSYTAFRGR